MLVEIKDMLAVVAQNIVRLQFQASDTMHFKALDPTKGMPIMLEDPLGFVLEIPLDCVHDWDVSLLTLFMDSW